MPNHVYQKIRISDWNYTDKFKELKNKIFNESNVFDFNLLIPQPSNIFLGNLGDRERKLCEEQKLPNWYDWNVENWNTKWNAYGQKIISNDNDTIELLFQTAWNIPQPIIDKIFEVFKDFEIEYLAVDEGSYFAKYIYKNSDGELTTKDLTESCEVLLFSMCK